MLLTHSQSGTFHWPIADARPNLVKAIIAVEPNGPPVYETEFKGAPEWFADMGKKKSSGLGEVPLTYDPPLKDGEELAFVRQDKPDRPDLVRCWQQAEPARKLKNLAGIPIAIVMSEASYHASYDHCTANYLTQAGVRNTMIALGDARHPRQRPHDDAGKELRRHRRRDARLAAEGGAGEGLTDGLSSSSSWDATARVCGCSAAMIVDRPMLRAYLYCAFAAFFFGADFLATFFALFLPLPHNSLLASRAPSASDCSLAH